MTSRYRRGDAVTPTPREKDLHLHGYQVVRILTIVLIAFYPPIRP
ncbi:MAG: hypothetical protein AAFR83_05445 [Cyanobacteria bacterium J06629_18]